MDFVAEQLEAEVRNGTVHYHAMDSGDADYDWSSIRRQRALRGTNIRIHYDQVVDSVLKGLRVAEGK